MNKRFGWLVGAGLLGAWLVMSMPSARAEENSENQVSYAQGAAQKLGRGVCNIVTCPLELIRVPELTGRTSGYLAAGTAGLAEGTVRMVVRGVGGVVEVVTFFINAPPHFAPIVHPEFVWTDGDWAE